MAKMTLRACMEAALQLMNQYSIAGTEIPLSYNDQRDTWNRMVNPINDAVMEIATTVRNIEESFEYVVTDEDGKGPLHEIEVPMPEDYYSFSSLTFVPAHGRMRITKHPGEYRRGIDDSLLLPSRPAGTYTIAYNRYPVRYDSNTDLDTELDNTPDTHEIVPYFVAAVLSIDENPKTYYALYNIWETRLSRLGYKNPHTEAGYVEDVYGFGNFRGLW